jgi:apoptosis-inducing factor 3
MAEHQIGLAENLLQDGQMKRIDVEGKPIVVARVQGEYFAFGGNCPHYSAHLDEGVLRGHSIMCPLHHACFDIRSGKRLEPPALNDVAHYPIQIRDGSVILTSPNDNVTAPQGKADPAATKSFVIIGGGAAGAAAAEELRRGGFTGKITMISAEDYVPIDRPNLSKDYLDGHAKPEWMPLRSKDWYAQRDIDLMLNTRVSSIQPDTHTIFLDGGSSIQYNKLLIATGGIPRHLDKVPGADLQGIYLLRSWADADRIIHAAQEKKQFVIIGASFIGMEVAAALAGGRGASVTVVGLEKLPFAPILGEKIGQMFQAEHEKNNVRFRLDNTVTRFIGNNGTITQVELKNGEVLDADAVIMGVGVRPATDFLRESGLKLDEKDASVLVNEHLQSSAPDIYAAGDIARHDGVRIEHWRVAQQHGMVAAQNMLGEVPTISQHVPFFWTMQWDIALRYVGHAAKWDEIIYRGSPEQKKFIAFYLNNGELKAVAGCGHDAEMDAIEFILRDRLPLSPAQMRDESFDLIAYVK